MGRAGLVLVIAKNTMPAIVFVPGIWDAGGTFDHLAKTLGEAGWRTYDVSLTPNDGSVPFSRLVKELRKFANDTLGRRRRFDIVAFSMGGLVVRSYVQRLGGLARAARFVTISTPHQGTNTADLGSLPGFLEIRPDIAFLLDLNRDASRLSGISFTSIRRPLVLMIVPAESSRAFAAKK
jgi:triacylglycerol lipase